MGWINKLMGEGQQGPSGRAASESNEMDALFPLATTLAGPESIERKAQKTIEIIKNLFNAEVGLFHSRGNNGMLTLKAYSGLAAEDTHRFLFIQTASGAIGNTFTEEKQTYGTGKPEVPAMDSYGLPGRVLSIPLKASGSVLGTLTIAGRKIRLPSDTRVLGVIGTMLGFALESERDKSRIADSDKQIALTNELSGAINTSLSIGTLFRIMVSEIRKVVSFDRSSLLLYNEKEDSLLIFALETQMKTVMPKGMKAPVEGTSAGWAIRNNQPVINRDLKVSMQFPEDSKLLEDGIRSSVSFPLYQDKMLGVFNLDSTEPGKYNERHLTLLIPVANHISIALENALLFDAISKEKREWEKTFDAITDMVWIEDLKQRTVRANQALLKKVGLPASKLGGIHCTELMSMIGIDPDKCPCESEAPSGDTSFREIRGFAGSIYHFWGYPLKDDEGKPYALVHYLKDVTAQKKIELQLIRNDKLASLGILGAGIAHEINNPLGIIAGYTEALIDRAGDKSLNAMGQFEDFPEYLDTIHKEIFRCKEMLGSLLGFAMPPSDKARRLDVNELIKEVMLLVNHKVKSINCDLVLNLDSGLSAISADPGSLRQLFLNIIVNAIYYTPEGGRIEVRTAMDEDADIEPLGPNRGRVLIVSISDSGPGIPKDIIEKIFDPFYTTKPIGEGTGLGLSICHKIAEDNGGIIHVESIEGQGAVFNIRLPADSQSERRGSKVREGK